MAINHELSSDIAVALLTGKDKGREELNHLKEVIFKIHHALQSVSVDARARSRKDRRDGQSRKATNSRR